MTEEQRTTSLMHAFGWQGGTIHQVAERTGCSPADILYTPIDMENTLFWEGHYDGKHGHLDRSPNGIIQYWLGVAKARLEYDQDKEV